MMSGGTVAHPTRTIHLGREVTSASTPAAPIAKTQSATAVALRLSIVMNKLYAVRGDGDVPKCTPKMGNAEAAPLINQIFFDARV